MIADDSELKELRFSVREFMEAKSPEEAVRKLMDSEPRFDPEVWAQASEQLDAVLTGPDMVVSLKPQFLLDGLSGVHTEFVRLSFTKTENPN